jgi:hypothetical protein
VVSGGRRNSVIKSLTALGLLDKFETIVGAEDYKNSKPAPDAFLLPPSASASRPPIAWSLKTPTSASRPQPLPAWPRSASPRPKERRQPTD